MSNVYYDDDYTCLVKGDVLESLKKLPDEYIQCAVTSPPYWGLRDYGEEGQLGLEKTPDQYVNNLANVFDELKRVLRDDGTFWLNLGDSYANNCSRGSTGSRAGFSETESREGVFDRTPGDLKQKDLVGIPWRVALELQSRGWYLRNDIIWNKPNPMPESVTDRCTTSHEHIFLMTKSKDYFYDQDAIREPLKEASLERREGEVKESDQKRNKEGIDPNGINTIHQIKSGDILNKAGANKRDVWEMTVASMSEAHFAVFPSELPKTCLKAGGGLQGKCTECKKSLVRETEEEVSLESGSGKAGNKPEGKHENRKQTDSGDYDVRMGGTPRTKTTVWKKECDCNTDETEPTIVLDPFSGAGTTGMVAKKLGMKYIGIDLGADYHDMAIERIQGVKFGEGFEEKPDLPDEAKFLTSIDGIGEKTAWDIWEHFDGNIHDIVTSGENLEEVDGIGPKTRESFIDQIKSNNNDISKQS